MTTMQRPYPARLTGRIDAPLSRWRWLIKWLLLIPHFIVLVFLWIAAVLLTVVAGFAILFTARYPRWVTGPKDEIERIARDRGRMLLYDAKGNPLILFEDSWGLRWVLEREKGVEFHEVAP